MKKIVLFTLLVTVPIATIFSSPRDWFSEGYWYNDSYGIVVSLKGSEKKIKIREGRRGKWHTYKRKRYGIYRDKYGNSIQFRNYSSFVWQKRGFRRGLRFYKEGYSNRRGYYDRDRYRNNDRQRNQRRDPYYREDRYDDRGTVRPPSRNGSWTGNWYSSNRKYSVEFDNWKDDGLRARKGRGEDWHYYKNDPYEPNVYVDEKGNQYIFSDDGSCTWLSHRGRDKIRFRR